VIRGFAALIVFSFQLPAEARGIRWKQMEIAHHDSGVYKRGLLSCLFSEMLLSSNLSFSHTEIESSNLGNPHI